MREGSYLAASTTISTSMEEGRLPGLTGATPFYIVDNLIDKGWSGGTGEVYWRDVLPHTRRQQVNRWKMEMKRTLHWPTFTISQKIDLEYKNDMVVVEGLVFGPYLPDARWCGRWKEPYERKTNKQRKKKPSISINMQGRKRTLGKIIQRAQDRWMRSRHEKEGACFNEENLDRWLNESQQQRTGRPIQVQRLNWS
ncbi:hypothetical protein PPACK8108_LOCUS16131 [Phakopsora pachyrhizi]|uniref:Uncharacterized protein n=1 Tax=Phakopsora pachyrhizi TaxID=170000 RepID=A0AAV0BAZ5_PHAPC|nr:hypothetical protein PPACK8108_LOCUS16131 [Phakopsora pachyrhizi]